MVDHIEDDVHGGDGSEVQEAAHASNHASNGKSDGQVRDYMHRPPTRAARLVAIESILTHNVVESQSMLSKMLLGKGFKVTQATLSRDLDELCAVKVRLRNGHMAYRVGRMQDQDGMEAEKIEHQLSRGFSTLIVSVACAGNIVVVHTIDGAAQYLATVMDKQEIDNLLGTLAGDDTLLLICASEEAAVHRSKWLLDIASKEPRQRK